MSDRAREAVDRLISMDIERTEVILTSKLPGRSVPWEGKLMAVLNGSVLYVPVAFWRKGV